MRLPDSASIFTAEVWVIIKALEQIKDSVASKYIIFTDSLENVSSSFTVYEAVTSLDWNGDTKGRKEMFYLTTHSTHFTSGYMASDIWLRTNLIVRKETRCRKHRLLFPINNKGSFICTIPQTG